MAEITVSGIFFYPVKSLAGIELDRAGLDPCGIRYDRHWMLVDQEGEFLSQRQLPRMALIRTRLAADRLCLNARGMPDLMVPLTGGVEANLEVRVWQDRCLARTVGFEADRWLSRFLDRECRLVYLPGDSVRRLDPDYARPTDQTAFSDGFPLLLISEASLRDLNSRLAQPLAMKRFRPNLVVTGCAPYAEDGWRRIRVGGIEFRLVKPCARCAVTTIDPESGRKGEEPLRTLSQYRRTGNRILFGQNVIHDSCGEIRLGMKVEVLVGA